MFDPNSFIVRSLATKQLRRWGIEMKLSRQNHIVVISLAALIILLPISAVSAKKVQPKPASIVELIAPNSERIDAPRDAMFRAAFGKAHLRHALSKSRTTASFRRLCSRWAVICLR